MSVLEVEVEMGGNKYPVEASIGSLTCALVDCTSVTSWPHRVAAVLLILTGAETGSLISKSQRIWPTASICPSW